MITEIVHIIQEKKYSALLKCAESVLPKKMIENVSFFKHEGRFINFSNPQTFDEILHILKCREYLNNELVTICTDKVLARSYVREKGLESILNEIYFNCSSTADIPWDNLPSSFAMKCNHGCGYNIIVRDKNELNVNLVKSKLDYWMEENYGIRSGEYHYKNIKPQILCEKYIGDSKGNLPIDYKFFCSRGKVICVLVIVGRGKKVERVFVDKNFDDMNFVHEYSGQELVNMKTECFDRMIDIAECLSMDFPFVRVDLYDINGSVVFGELTFSPHGCYHEYLNSDIQKWIAKQITL